ncbi:MAG: hypothetical protein LBG19_08640 [Prevotellaceae bacterium]|nr:hypothetical protein [Prevotellaceae bacterium]
MIRIQHIAIVLLLISFNLVSLNVSANPKDRSYSYIDWRYAVFTPLLNDTIQQQDMQMDDPKTFLLKRPVFIGAKYSGEKRLLKAKSRLPDMPTAS